MGKNKSNFIFKETDILHDLVTQLYESLMEKEDLESLKILNLIPEKCRDLKKDLLTKEK